MNTSLLLVYVFIIWLILIFKSLEGIVKLVKHGHHGLAITLLALVVAMICYVYVTFEQ